MISQLIKGGKEKFFIKPNFRQKYQTSSSGQKFFSKNAFFCQKTFFKNYLRQKFGLIKNFSLLPFINWLINMIPRILIFATINCIYCFWVSVFFYLFLGIAGQAATGSTGLFGSNTTGGFGTTNTAGGGLFGTQNTAAAPSTGKKCSCYCSQLKSS